MDDAPNLHDVAPEGKGLEGSNSLADLAARINAEHEAVGNALQRGLDHALAAGRLLIEAKKQFTKRGEWLPWLKANCAASVRSAQAYMQVARQAGDDPNAQRVAHTSFRDALRSMAGEQAEGWVREVRHAKHLARRNSYTLETPAVMLPSATGQRKMRVARNPKKQQWMLAIGPNISRAELIERENAARDTAAVQQMERERQDMLDRAAALEAEAKAMRKQAIDVEEGITQEIRKIIGPTAPFTETYTFQASKKVDAELAALPQPDQRERQLFDRLLAARGKAGRGLTEIERGYWGDMRLLSAQQIGSVPSSPGAPDGWTKIGSPEWLAELFPGLHESEQTPDQAPELREAAE